MKITPSTLSLQLEKMELKQCLKKALYEASIEYLRRMLSGSSSEKTEKADRIVTVEEQSLPDEPKEEPKATTESVKKAEGETERKPRLNVHETRRVLHELLREGMDQEEQSTEAPSSATAMKATRAGCSALRKESVPNGRPAGRM